MPGNVVMIQDEREGLLGFLEQQRQAIRYSSYGLTDDLARATPAASSLSIGGLIKHVATTERGWIDRVLQRQRPEESDADAYLRNFRLGPDETLAGVLALYQEVAAETAAAVAGIDDLSRPVPVPKGVPWFPQDLEAWSVRWVLFHLIEEAARHAGHADIVRESIDGAAAMPLMAAAEGWPATGWLKPWEPA
ncbi:MAG TPA: DinB family protein [Candidatus Dormibacteraeota bacterium]|jgi:uncharacterized damage-inducible protein DinB|nr:DinB family protein [Candidatus Dormibacteraeota bacterium]